MTGRDLIGALEHEGFRISRRAKTFVWLTRGAEVLLVDEAANIADEVAAQVLEKVRSPRG